MTDKKELPIAVIDSGVGGISVLRCLLETLPFENYIYFGDSANAPYGTRERSEVLQITRQNLEHLRERGIKALVIACNTATSAAAKELREENPDLIIVGIEPAVKPAAELCNFPTVLIMATPLTLREEKFTALVSRFSKKGRFIPLACPGLVELIEQGFSASSEISEYLSSLLSPYRNENIDAVVLGCTHYPHIKNKIASYFPKSTVILDGGSGTARETKRRLENAGLLRDAQRKGYLEILNSSNDRKMIELSRMLLNKKQSRE